MYLVMVVKLVDLILVKVDDVGGGGSRHHPLPLKKEKGVKNHSRRVKR